MREVEQHPFPCTLDEFTFCVTIICIIVEENEYSSCAVKLQDVGSSRLVA